MREQRWRWKTVSTTCVYSKMSQNLFTVNHVRTVEAMEISKHDVPVLEVGQDLFTISHARNNGDDGDRTR